MSFPRGVPLIGIQDLAFLPSFTIWLTAANGWKVVPSNGIYAPPGDVLYFFAAPDNPYIPGQRGAGNMPNIVAANFLMAPLPPIASFVGNPLCIVFDQQAYRVADGKPSGTTYAPPSGSGPMGAYASITIPAGELFLTASWGLNQPSSQAFVCPAAYAARMGWQISSIGG